ncbi:MAG: MFS transporter [Actinobacteria bacterium]|nr:MAG: MFS transporter [Actinomycetota bacterium]
MTEPASEHEQTIEPATLGSTPSSADSVEVPTGGPKAVSNWPMWMLGFVLLMDSMDQSIVRGIITPLKEAFHVGDAAIGVLTSAFILVNGLITVPAGYLADRWHRTRTIGHTVVAWSGLTALGGVAPNFATLVGLRAALGFGQAITEPSAASLLSDYYPTEQRGRAFSIQQIMLIAGFGLGIGVGGAVGATLGWRWAFVVVGGPGMLVAALAYRLREPKRGAADRLHVGIVDDDDADVETEIAHGLFDEGFGTFMRDMAQGLRADLRTIWGITTMRYALVGVSALLFTINAVGTWLPQFYERQLHVANGRAEGYVGIMVILGGVPGILLGGRLADRYATRVRGARVAIPAYCILVGTTFFTISLLRVPFAPAFALEVIGFFVITMAIPGLRAGLSDAIPANLRGAGFGAFNLVSVIFGGAAAPLIVSVLSQTFGDNLRTAFLIIMPPVYVGAWILLRAREHLDADAMKIFEAVLTAMQEQQERDAERGGGRDSP